MNDNYLWDKTGDVDAEVQELEELLGSLKYQPRPLHIPVNITASRKPLLIPLAIAAAVAVLMIAAGLWIRLTNSKPAVIQQARHDSPTTAPPREIVPVESLAVAPPAQTAPPNGPAHRRANRSLGAASRRPIPPTTPALTDQQLAEREQVLIALRLVSAKLNFAQRKTQGFPQVNSIRNQHKIG